MQLEDVQNVCKLLLDKKAELTNLQEQEKTLTADIRRLSEEVIPEMLDELGLSKITTQDGYNISTTMDVSASIPVDQRPAALNWLDRNGFGDLIKTKVQIHFTRDQRDQAVQTEDQLITQGYNVTLDESVHPMTLKSWIKEQLAEGNNIPMDLFGARQYYKTVIKSTKK